jgi:hypothetical protein
MDGARAWLLLSVAAIAACGNKTSDPGGNAPAGSSGPVAIAPQGKVLEAAENESQDAGPSAKRPEAPALAAGARVDIPKGKLISGSTPGDRGRDPTLEPALAEVELGGFAIDRYLDPNDPAKPALTGVSRARAGELCAQVGGRLCTELEWERACKGPDDNAYAGGSTWDPSCGRTPDKCASGFGVLGMGAALREWTASEVVPAEGAEGRAGAVRGARASSASHDHRCAHRAAVDPAVSSDDLGFRCCYGPPNAAAIPKPAFQQTFRKAELTAKQASEMLSTVPQLAELSKDVIFFKEPDDIQRALARGDAGVHSVPNTSFTTHPILWSPVPGEEILVIAGRSMKNSFIVAFYRLPGDRYRLGSSFIMKDEKGPVVLGTNNYNRKRIPWALCWDCRGESGFVSYRDDNRVVITQK